MRVSSGVCVWSCTLAISPVSVPRMASEWTGLYRSHVVRGPFYHGRSFSFLGTRPSPPRHELLSSPTSGGGETVCRG